MPIKVLSVFGTRPEAIKMAPLVLALQHDKAFTSQVCVTAQHRQMLDQVLDLFQIQPDSDLNLMRPNQSLAELTSHVLLGMGPVFEKFQPDMVLVHGDTTTTMAVSLAAYYQKIPVGHVEAGLRTFDKYYPFPEEINRVVTDSIASLYFAPTQRAVDNLIKAQADPKGIVLTGNTVIDALLYTLKQTKQKDLPVQINPKSRMILVTVHRRENFGEPMEAICRALKTLVQQFEDIELVIPVHLNPNVRQTVFGMLDKTPRVHLIEPQEYETFCQLMQHAYLILTDSGGVQEEAPSLKKPVLVLRDETERPEAVEMGTVKLVGPHEAKIIAEASLLLSDPSAYQSMAQQANPYGDGKACQRILEALKTYFKH